MSRLVQPGARPRAQRTLLPRIATRARLVLTVSGFSARELRAHLSVEAQVVPAGTGRRSRPLADAARARASVGLTAHVVLQHVPDPAITYGYIEEVGRVLRPGGWAAFQVSDDASIHRARGGVRTLGQLRRVADASGLDVERVTGEGSQFCIVALRRRGSGS